MRKNPCYTPIIRSIKATSRWTELHWSSHVLLAVVLMFSDGFCPLKHSCRLRTAPSDKWQGGSGKQSFTYTTESSLSPVVWLYKGSQTRHFFNLLVTFKRSKCLMFFIISTTDSFLGLPWSDFFFNVLTVRNMRYNHLFWVLLCLVCVWIMFLNSMLRVTEKLYNCRSWDRTANPAITVWPAPPPGPLCVQDCSDGQ